MEGVREVLHNSQTLVCMLVLCMQIEVPMARLSLGKSGKIFH